MPPLLDEATIPKLGGLAAGETAVLRDEVLRLLAEDTPRRLANMRTAVDDGDTAALTREAHALKGKAGIIGACARQAAARQIEQIGRDGTLRDAALHLAGSVAAYKRTHEALAALVAPDTP